MSLSSRGRATFRVIPPMVACVTDGGRCLARKRGALDQRRHGAILAALGFVVMIMGVLALVINVAGQASMTRSLNASAIQGRYAIEMAESAVDECLADFGKTIAPMVSGRDLRAEMLAAARGGVVPGAAILRQGLLVYTPVQTPRIIGSEKLGVKVSRVTIRPMYYSTLHNYGEVELTCQASYEMAGKRELFRRVTARQYITLDANGRTFRVNPVPCRTVADRSSEE